VGDLGKRDASAVGDALGAPDTASDRYDEARPDPTTCSPFDAASTDSMGHVAGCDGDAGCSEAGPLGMRLLRAPASWGIPNDALFVDTNADGERLLLSSFTGGLVELAWPSSSPEPRTLRGWAAPDGGVFGVARYGPCGTIVASVYGRGILIVRDAAETWILPSDGLVSQDILNVLVRSNGDVWVAGTPEPFGVSTGKVQAIRDGRILWTSQDVWQIASWIDVPERDSVFAAATQGGVVEIHSDGTSTLLETDDLYPATLLRQPGGNAIAFNGSGGLREWNGTAFSLVAFSGPYPTLPPSLTTTAGFAIDAQGHWFFNHMTGYVLVADSTHAILGDFDGTSGLPPSASEPFVQPSSGRVFVSSINNEAVSVLIPWSGL
jgi:hypothetical protein